jgi:hypothetical protein
MRPYFSLSTLFITFVHHNLITKKMYRQIFIPNGQNISIPVPQQWWGRKIEVIAYPVSKDTAEEQSPAAKRKKLDALLDQHLFNLRDFKFNRDEANEYD